MILTKEGITYTCSICKQTYTADPNWTEDDMKEEARESGMSEKDLIPENRAVVCDLCYPAVLKKWNIFKGSN